MKLVLLGQPADEVSALAAQLVHPGLQILSVDALAQAPDWSTLTPNDLVLLLARTPAPLIDWRPMLMASGQAFQVIHPSDQPLHQEVLWALGHHLRRTVGDSPWPLRREIPARWQGMCETCSDPECEHLLFRRLVGISASNA